MSRLDRRVQRLEQERAPIHQRVFSASYEFDDAHRCIGIRESSYGAGRLVSRLPNETPDELVARTRLELGIGTDDLFILRHAVFADNGRPCPCGNCREFRTA
jgi:hypothetical protein